MLRRLGSFIPIPRQVHPRDGRRWSAGALALGVVWLGVAVTLQAAKAKQADPAVVVEAAKAVGLPENQEDRAAAIERLSQRMQRLSLTERVEPELVVAVEGAFQTMTPAEQHAFIRDVMPPGLEMMVQAFQAMDETERRLVIDRLRREFKHAGWIDADTDRASFNE
ncbi:MAG: hypothetical protein AAGJ38_07740, partial [Planctomycetota bacterium]